jgi:uncharacterized protein (TIGR00730 family)
MSQEPKPSAMWECLADPRDVELLAGTERRGDEAMAARIASEFMKGCDAFRNEGDCVTVFGSARFSEAHPYYELARAIGHELGKAGFTVMTGGGPGTMEAANRGAKEAGARSLGCNITLPLEQEPNPYLDRMVEFHYFFVRKLLLIRHSCAFVVMPGGFGTLDEVFETLTLIQTGKIKDFPIVAMGRDYWQHLRPFLEQTMVQAGTIDEADLDHVFPTDDPAEATQHILDRRRGAR